MKLKLGVAWVGLIGLLCCAQDDNKQTADVKRVVGTVNNTYSLVRTTIRRLSPSSSPSTPSVSSSMLSGQTGATAAAESKPIITREQVGLVGPLRKNSGPIDVSLYIPMLDAKIKTYGAPQLTNKIGQLVGAVSTNPKGQMAGVGISTIGVLADYATQVAEQELNEAYGTQDYKFTVLEIIPTAYYQINSTNQKIEVTDRFLEDFPIYQKQLQRYKIAFELLRNINKVYAEWVQLYRGNYTQLAARNPAAAQRQAQLIRDYYDNAVQPALDVKNREERALSDMYPPYRIAIMASPMEVGAGCGSSGKGPWEFNIVYYLGAQQTNKIGVKYCVPNPKDNQRLQVSLVHNAINELDSSNQVFVPGGVKLVQALGDPSGQPNINFAQQTGYGALETEVFNWFTAMVTSPDGGDISQFLVPFDIYELKKAYVADKEAQKQAKFNTVLASVDQVILQAEKAKREMQAAEEKAKEAAARSKYDASGPNSFEGHFDRSFGKGELSGGIPIEPEMAEDEEAVIKEFEAKGQALERDLGDAPPAYPGTTTTATTAPKPGTIAYPWREVATVQAERDDLARDILTLKSVPGVDIAIPRSLQEKWSPTTQETNKAGADAVTRYTEYFRALQAKDISMLDAFLRDLKLGYKENPVEPLVWADKNSVKQERDMLAADIQTIKKMDRIPEQMSWKWNPDRLDTLNDKMRYREYTKALIAKDIAGLDKLLRDKGVL